MTRGSVIDQGHQPQTTSAPNRKNFAGLDACLEYTRGYDRPVARISQGGGGLIRGKVDLKPKGGGGVSFGKNVDLCNLPYGAFGPKGRGSTRLAG